jgi:S-formylglutathione hydrolase FrmB
VGVSLTLRRRTLLAAAAGLAVAPSGALAGCGGPATGAAGRPGSPAAAGPGGRGGALLTGQFESRYVPTRRTGWRLALPPDTDPDRPVGPDGAPLPVCVVLHGRGGSAGDLTIHGYQQGLVDAVRAGAAPLAAAAVDGGESYWHDRRSGEDTGRMVAEEFLPMLAERGLAAGPTARIGLAGLSMGGYGALLLAVQWGAARVAAVGAMSPALWVSPGDSAAGAFDDRADFLAHDMFSRRPALRGVRIRIDCGRSDPFYRATRSFVAGLDPQPEGGFDAGGHDAAYWRAHAQGQLAFVSRVLAAFHTK